MDIKVILWVMILVILGLAIFRVIKAKEAYEATKLPVPPELPPTVVLSAPTAAPAVLKHLPQKLVPTAAPPEPALPQASSFPPEFFKKPDGDPQV